eukprot:14796865-Alexandrium_andersonii.AAC.1
MRNAGARARASVYSHGKAVQSHFEAKAILQLAQARGQGLRGELGVATQAELHTAAQGTARPRGGA